MISGNVTSRFEFTSLRSGSMQRKVTESVSGSPPPDGVNVAVIVPVTNFGHDM